jgi:polyhydroxyalkanoate synthesis repressor PhaR
MACVACNFCEAQERLMTAAPCIVIKKYSNRRLYDTTQSCYVTLGRIRKMVVAREDFVVIDHRSETDVTRQVLLQALMDQEVEGKAKMSRDALERLIRAAAAREE